MRVIWMQDGLAEALPWLTTAAVPRHPLRILDAPRVAILTRDGESLFDITSIVPRSDVALPRYRHCEQQLTGRQALLQRSAVRLRRDRTDNHVMVCS